MKNLLFVLHNLSIGGTESIVTKLAINLKNDYQISVLVLDKKGEFANLLAKENIPIYYLNRRQGWKLENFIKFFKIIRLIKPDIINAHQYSSVFFSIISKIFFITNAKIIFTEHGRHYPDYVSLKRKLANKILFKFVTKITAVSNFTKTALIKNEGLTSNIDIIYNGIISKFDTNINLRQELKLPNDAKIIGFIGSLRRVKNPMLAIEVFKNLNIENSYLVFIGDGDLRNDLKEKVNQYQVNDKVFFLGNKFPAINYLKDLDIFIQTSFSEANPLALLEAQSLGIPCVVTDVGGTKDVITNRENGILVPIDDVVRFRNAILDILNNNQLRNKLSDNSKEVFNKKFREDIMFQSYRELFKQL